MTGSGCISYTKGTILKANHNIIAVVALISGLYLIYQRYDFVVLITILKASHNSQGDSISHLKSYFRITGLAVSGFSKYGW